MLARFALSPTPFSPPIPDSATDNPSNMNDRISGTATENTPLKSDSWENLQRDKEAATSLLSRSLVGTFEKGFDPLSALLLGPTIRDSVLEALRKIRPDDKRVELLEALTEPGVQDPTDTEDTSSKDQSKRTLPSS